MDISVGRLRMLTTLYVMLDDAVESRKLLEIDLAAEEMYGLKKRFLLESGLAELRFASVRRRLEAARRLARNGWSCSVATPKGTKKEDENYSEKKDKEATQILALDEEDATSLSSRLVGCAPTCNHYLTHLNAVQISLVCSLAERDFREVLAGEDSALIEGVGGEDQVLAVDQEESN